MKINRYILICLLSATTVCFSQETTIELPTNDNTSSFIIKKNNGAEVFSVDGTGEITGDGSGLSNVKSGIKYAESNLSVYFHEGLIPGLNLYEAQIMREVTINCPGPGIILALASGYCDWESINEDLVRIWFHPHPTVSPTSSWETPDFHNLRIVSDYQCADSSDQYTSWSISKVYSISSAQSYTVRICADKPFTESKFLIGDVAMQLLFFPTGGVSPIGFQIATSNEPEHLAPDAGININTIDGSPGNISANDHEKESGYDEIDALKKELDAIKQKLNMLLENSNR